MEEPLATPGLVAGMSADLRVCLLAAHLSRHSGGLAASVPPLARELEAQGVEVTVLGLRDPLAPEDWRDWGPRVGYVDPKGPRRLAFAPELGRALAELSPDVVDVQGIWMYLSVASLAHGRRTGRPYVVTPRGMLDPWALGHHRWRKRVLAWLFEKRHLGRAACLRATSEMEARHIRSFGLCNPVAVVPNGVDVPEAVPLEPEGEPTVLYLGRLHPKKGVDLLLHAWSRVERERRDWRLRIVGNDENGHRRDLERLATDLGLRRVSFHGPVHGAEKWTTYAAADLLVLPTRSENFGMVVAEALACATPAVVTKGAPWESIEREGCGWWVDVDAHALARALLDATALERNDLADMGRRGRAYVARTFAWGRVAVQMAAVYRWVTGAGLRPEWVLEL